MYVIDSHALVFYFLGTLNKNVRKIFENQENLYVPTIALAELQRTIDKRIVELNSKKIINKIKSNPRYKIIAFDLEIFDEFLKIKDMEIHDQIIVATARHLNLPLITKDKRIIESKLVKIIW